MSITNIQQTDSGDSSTRVTPLRTVDPAESAPKGTPAQALKSVNSGQKTEDAKNQQTKLDVSEAQEMTEALNAYMDILQTNLGFSIREELNRQVVVEIKNRNTDELVKQIPSEELLKIMENMKELTGIIFDQSV